VFFSNSIARSREPEKEIRKAGKEELNLENRFSEANAAALFGRRVRYPKLSVINAG
jgi:hypothetical protein